MDCCGMGSVEGESYTLKGLEGICCKAKEGSANGLL